jgi:hypothetical protein
MSDRLQETLKHQYIYVPRGTEKDTLALGKRLGLAVARELRARMTVLSVQKGGAAHHAELAKLPVVTERSGSMPDGGVVLAWCPRHKTMEKLQHLEKSVVVLVEWIPGEMDAWARLHEAYNVVTGEVMESGLEEEAIELLEGIVAEGYNGWTKNTDARMTKSYLEDMSTAGAYDRNLVLAYARQTKHEASVERLVKILDEFERTLPSTGTPRRLVL